MRLTEADHLEVTAAVTAAEAGTDGEIVTIVTRQSDAYHDVALHWAMLAALLAVALLAFAPGAIVAVHQLVDPWTTPPPGELIGVALAIGVAVFLLIRLLLASPAARIAMTPKATTARRVRARALRYFAVGAEKRTKAKTGVLLYVSLLEHRAEIVADEAIASRVTPEVWGEAMAALVAELRAGHPGTGMAAAVTRIGIVLAAHFPRSEGDTNELPDRLIEL